MVEALRDEQSAEIKEYRHSEIGSAGLAGAEEEQGFFVEEAMGDQDEEGRQQSKQVEIVFFAVAEIVLEMQCMYLGLSAVISVI